MVQIIPQGRRSLGHGLLEGLAEGSADALGNYLGRRKENKQITSENEELGIPQNVKNQRLRELFLSNRASSSKDIDDQRQIHEQADRLRPILGDTFATIYENAPTGGQTKLLEHALQARSRGISFEDYIGQAIASGKEDIMEDILPAFERSQIDREEVPNENDLPSRQQLASEPEFAQPVKVEKPKRRSFPKIKIPGNKTPKEREQYRSELRKENVPKIKEVSKKIRTNANERHHLDILESLNQSGALPRGFKKIGTVNPETGEVRKWAQLVGLTNPETELFTKTVNDFTAGAKDTFGGRVTNFDLQVFKSRLPSLINSKEGIDLIINQMRTLNQLDDLYENELADIFDAYGADGIPPEKAERMAEKNIQSQAAALSQQFFRYENAANQLADSNERVNVEGPDGTPYSLPKAQLEAALSQGFREI